MVTELDRLRPSLRRRGARLARREESKYCWYVTEPQRSQPGGIRVEGARLGHSRAIGSSGDNVGVSRRGHFDYWRRYRAARLGAHVPTT